MNKHTPMKFINQTKTESTHNIKQPTVQNMPLKEAETYLTESEKRFCDAQEISGVEETLTSLKNR